MATAITSKLTCRVVRSPDQLAQLELAWREVWAQDPNSTIFQSYDWVSTWVKWYNNYIADLFILVCEVDQRCVGLAPLYVRAGSLIKLKPRTLMFTGTGEPEAVESFAEYMAPICLPKFLSECYEAFAWRISESRKFHQIEFTRVREDLVRPLVKRLDSPRWREKKLGHCYGMPSRTRDALAGLSARGRNSMKRNLNRLLTTDGVSFRVADTEPSRQAMFADLVALHTDSWEARGFPGVFSNHRFRAFHDALSSKLLESGELMLLSVSINDTTVAVIYGMCDEHACRFYQSGINFNALPSVSLGLASHLLAAQAAAERGIGEYDLLLSSRVDYKARIARPTFALWTFRVTRVFPIRR